MSSFSKDIKSSDIKHHGDEQAVKLLFNLGRCGNNDCGRSAHALPLGPVQAVDVTVKCGTKFVVITVTMCLVCAQGMDHVKAEFFPNPRYHGDARMGVGKLVMTGIEGQYFHLSLSNQVMVAIVEATR